MARFIAAQICASVLGDLRVLTNRPFVESLDITRLQFDPEAIRQSYAQFENAREVYAWTLDSQVLGRLIDGQSVVADEVELFAGVGGV